MNDYTPAYLKNGEWTALPMKEEDLDPGKSNSADAITPDGSRICGGAAIAAFGIEAEQPMLVPVIWDRQADGTYGMYTVLPYPEKDFAGAVPQYITARDMSADGKTIVGTVTDNTGFVVYPIVFRQDAEGKWSYEEVLTQLTYNTEVTFPTQPIKPTKPNAKEYADKAALEAYNAAAKLYNDSLQAYYASGYDFDLYPSYEPTLGDFLTGESKSTYDALYAAYETAYEAYKDSAEVCDDFFYENVYFTSFIFNMTYISEDGKYITCVYTREEEGEDIWDTKLITTPYRYNVETKEYTVCELPGYVTSIMKDGSVMIIQPSEVNEMNRFTYVYGPDESCTPLEEYVAAKNERAGKMMAAALTAELAQFDPETGDILEETLTKVLSGTAITNNDGTVFASWCYNMGEVVGAEWGVISWMLDLNKEYNGEDDEDAINRVAADNTIASIVLTDLNGAVVNHTGNIKGLNKGVYLLTATTADGRTVTSKITKR